MGKPGPKKDPTKLLKMRGSWIAKGRTEDPGEPTEPPPPDYLHGYGLAYYIRTCKALYDLGLMRTYHQDSLALLALAFHDVRECLDDLKANGSAYVEHRKGLGVHPADKRKNEAFLRYCRLIREFGLTPSSIADVKIKTRKTESTMDDLLSKKQA